MDDGGPTASMFLFLLVLFLDAALYGFLSALQGLNMKEEERKAVEEKDQKASRLCLLNRNMESRGSLVQTLTSLGNLLAGCFCLRPVFRIMLSLSQRLSFAKGSWQDIWLRPAAAVLFCLLSLLFMLFLLQAFGIWLPRRAAAKNPRKWADRLGGFIWTLHSMFKPFFWLLSRTTAALAPILGIRGQSLQDDDTEYEIISMVNEGHERGVIQASEAEMITNIFEFSDKEARDIMTNRRDIVAIDCRMSFQDAVSFMLNGSNSRYPVYQENIDHIIGILHMKDALRRQSQIDPDKPLLEIPGLMRQVRFIPETRNIDSLFKTMQSMKLQMVIVVDEYGQTSGLIAMEDILEEIVGNILDEYDDEESFIQEKSKDEYVIEGKTRLEDLEERFSIHFEEEDFETINGYLISRLEHIPEPDEKFETTVGDYRFKILKVENKRITQVLVTRTKEPAGQERPST